MAGLPEEPCLQDMDAPLEEDGVDVFELIQGACLRLIADLGGL